MGNDLSYGQKVDIAAKWLILSRQLLCFEVFKWPIGGAFCLVAFWYFDGMSQAPVAVLIFSVFWILLSAYIAVHEAKNLILDKELRMQEVPRKNWFRLVGVEIVGEKTVKVFMLDLFGKQHTLYNSGHPSSFQWDIPANMQSWVAQEERSKWIPAVEAINSEVIERLVGTPPETLFASRAAPDPQTVRCD